MTTCTCGYHAPEQHGPSGCTMLGCTCKWDGKLDAKPATADLDTLREVAEAAATLNLDSVAGVPVGKPSPDDERTD